LRPEIFRHHEPVLDAWGNSLSRPALAWLNGTTGEMGDADWHDPARQLLGMYASSATEAFILWLYAGADPVDITLPDEAWGTGYRILIHTGEAAELPIPGEGLAPGATLTIPGRTAVLMQVKVPSVATIPTVPVVEPTPATPVV
ncbi:MAG: glycogen debranching enzyme GlgX, partial [Propionibacteriaceae bacterium]|nr:glycogen debranching enzyme GlgX [Propionibacteriaceae bacterium]